MTILDAVTIDVTRTDAMTPDATTPASAAASLPAASPAPATTAAAATPATPGTATPGTATPAAVTPDASAETPASGWTRICRVDDLLVERGAAALVGDRQIALFRTYDGRLYATDQIDPYSGAAILSRGIVGDRGGVPTVASPMYKQVFDLRTGVCLDTQGKEPLAVRVHPVAVTDGDVFVKIDIAAGDAEGENR